MWEKFWDFLNGSEPLAFESDFGLDETVKRLSAEIGRPFASVTGLAMHGPVVVGEVSEHSVALSCRHLLFRNGFKTKFLGRFRLIGVRVILIGKLSLEPAVGGTLAVWLAAMIALTLQALWLLLKNPYDVRNWLLPLGPPLVGLAAIAMFRGAKWLSSGDERWILSAINRALCKVPMEPARQ